MKRKKYNHGCVCTVRRKNGDIFVFRYRQPQADGTTKNCAITLGTRVELRTKGEAERRAEQHRLRINADSAYIANSITVGTLIDRFLAEEAVEGAMAYSTIQSYRCNLNKWVRQKWGGYTLQDVKTMAVEQWLRSLPMAPKSKLHIRNVMNVLFKSAMRWELTNKNPIQLVRQKGGRQRQRLHFRIEQFQSLLAELTVQPARMMVVLAGTLGLSRSEITGLKWADFDWAERKLSLQRGVVNGRTGETKNEFRDRAIPLADELVEELLEFRRLSPFANESDWVFASPSSQGHKPFYPENILKRYIRPAAEKANIEGLTGFHDFRHSYSSWLRCNGEDIQVQKELLRHADVGTTLNIYTQAPTEAKRGANNKLSGQLLGKQTAHLVSNPDENGCSRRTSVL